MEPSTRGRRTKVAPTVRMRKKRRKKNEKLRRAGILQKAKCRVMAATRCLLTTSRETEGEGYKETSNQPTPLAFGRAGQSRGEGGSLQELRQAGAPPLPPLPPPPPSSSRAHWA
ncbi:hypothetical protein MAPG_03025 [Magnaporthiopsis poae ATCC 64411]|uniref:Uncharacterized protein n=1 Tax=Magnaporthiopsis poae (strain ATCC 64411 / 73-15) TaxID=644358 RepID=A0A0C4DSY1_MAGP6|nr:hypothetical protein MAPG_03025 [Magnaporthiopsis poae ATCC 64411]